MKAQAFPGYFCLDTNNNLKEIDIFTAVVWSLQMQNILVSSDTVFSTLLRDPYFLPFRDFVKCLFWIKKKEGKVWNIMDTPEQISALYNKELFAIATLLGGNLT